MPTPCRVVYQVRADGLSSRLSRQRGLQRGFAMVEKREELVALADRLDNHLRLMQSARNKSQSLAVWADDVLLVKNAADALRALSSRDDGEAKTKFLDGYFSQQYEDGAKPPIGPSEAPSTIPADVLAMKEALTEWHNARQDIFTNTTKISEENAARWERLSNAEHVLMTTISRIDVPGKTAGLIWRDGVPPKPWSEEWFIAETTFHDRVVLKSLPEEWTYDFKTADETYIKADNIKRWMQFPDSQYIAPAPAAEQGVAVKVKPLEWSSEPPYSVARVLKGHYSVEYVEGIGADLRGTFLCRDFQTIAAAKSAAQADYETRIRSALMENK